MQNLSEERHSWLIIHGKPMKVERREGRIKTDVSHTCCTRKGVIAERCVRLEPISGKDWTAWRIWNSLPDAREDAASALSEKMRVDYLFMSEPKRRVLRAFPFRRRHSSSRSPTPTFGFNLKYLTIYG